MKMKKNEEYQIRIDDMGVNGEGIGKVDGITLFVKDALYFDNAMALPYQRSAPWEFP